MTENETQKTPSQASTQTMNPKASENVSPDSRSFGESRGSSGTGIAIAALVVAAIAVAASAYTWYSSNVAGRFEMGRELGRVDGLAREIDRLTEESARTEAQLGDALSQSLADRQEAGERMSAISAEWKTQIESLREQLANDNAQHQKEREAVAAAVAEMRARLGTVQQDWQLDEVAHVLSLANQQLKLAGDVRLAESALQIADQRLAERAEPWVLEVRRVIAGEILDLKRAADSDLTQTAMSFTVMINEIGTLPLKGDNDRPSWAEGQASASSGTSVASDTDSDSDTGFMGWIQRVVDGLLNLVRIRRVDDTRLPRLDVSERFLAYENLRLQLLVAQLAILKREQALYLNSLEQSVAWLESHFDVAPSVIRFSEQLTELKTVDLASAPPDISGSLNLLRAEIKRREQVQ